MADHPWSPDDLEATVSWRADCGQDVICRRCLNPGRGWRWDDHTYCEPCHRTTRGDEAVDRLILSDYSSFGEWWTEQFLDRVGGGATYMPGATL